MKKFDFESYEKTLATPEEDEQMIKNIAKNNEDIIILRDILKHSSRLKSFNGTSREDIIKQCLIARKSSGVLKPYNE